jgi:hypothetical protein
MHPDRMIPQVVCYTPAPDDPCECGHPYKIHSGQDEKCLAEGPNVVECFCPCSEFVADIASMEEDALERETEMRIGLDKDG